MHAILNDFLEKWVYPTGFAGPGVDFRLRQTERWRQERLEQLRSAAA